LFSIFRVVLREEMDVVRFVPRMLSVMPSSGDNDVENRNVYGSLTVICREFSGLMGQFGGEIVRVVAQILGMKPRDWRKWGLTEEIVREYVLLMRDLMGSIAEGQEIINVAIPDGEAMERFTQVMRSEDG
jgi:hypothetical protein